MHIHAPFNVLLEVFVVVFQDINCLHMAVFVRSLSFTSLPSFTFVSAAVSEIRESNRKKKKEKEKKNSEITNLTPFLGIYFTHVLTKGTF